jgi:hypothetical protein
MPVPGSILPWYRAALVGCIALALGCASTRQSAVPARAGGDADAADAKVADDAKATDPVAPAPQPPVQPGTTVPARTATGESGGGRSDGEPGTEPGTSGPSAQGSGKSATGSTPLLVVPPAAAPPGVASQGSTGSTGSQPSSGTQSGGAGAVAKKGSATAIVRMVPSALSVSTGDSLSIRVEIVGASDVGSVPFHVAFNPAVLKFEGGREGTFLQGDGKTTAFFAAPMSNCSEAVIGLSRLGAGTGVGGGGDLCTLVFRVVGPGDAGLAFTRAHVRDSTNGIAPADFQPASVTAR